MGITIGKKLSLEGTGSFTPLAEGEFSQPIQLNPAMMHNVGSAYKIYNPTGLPRHHTNLAIDVSTIGNVDGVPTVLPTNGGWGFRNYDTGVRISYNRTYHYVTVDLEDKYHLDYAYVHYNEAGTLNLRFWGSRDGGTWDIMANYSSSSDNRWRKVPFDELYAGGVRFVRFGMSWDEAGLYGLVFYGRKMHENIIKGFKSKRFVTPRNLNRTIGTNGFPFDDAQMVQTISENTRFYFESHWLMGADVENQGQGVDKTPDDIWLELETCHMGNLDQLFQGYKNTGQDCMLLFLRAPKYLRDYWVTNATGRKAVDPGVDYEDVSQTTNPMNYTHMARIWYYLAARYGRNRSADLSMLKFGPGETPRAGMDLLYALELGNEWEGYWLSQGGLWYSPDEMAAYMSACYDGHMGQMGPGFGIKNADQSMRVSNPGLVVSSNTAYIYEMMLWWDAHRGKGNYPLDIINIHHYNSTSNDQVTGLGAVGLQPEEGDMLEICKMWSDFRDRYMPFCEVWITETGYDEHLGGAISPNYPTWEERTLYKSYWLIRTMLATKAMGLDVANQYWFISVGSGQSYELNMQNYDKAKFKSCQYMDAITEHSSFYGHTPLTAFWYMYHFKKEIEGYDFSHFMVVNGQVKTNEALFILPDESEVVWVMALKNRQSGESMAVAWLSSGEFGSREISMIVPEANVSVVVIDEAEERMGENGEHTLVSSRIAGSSRVIDLVINECPLLIKTANIGTKKPEEVTNIRQQRLTNGDNLVVWDDGNIESYTAEIQRSTSADGPYSTIYTGDVFDASYVDTAAQVGVNYFYNINLLP